MTYRTYSIRIWHNGASRAHDVVACDEQSALADVLCTYGLQESDLTFWSYGVRS